MNQKLKVGQVWTWVIGDDPYNIDELYLLLRKANDRDNFLVATYGESVEHIWEALNLDSGQIELITPFFTAGLWELVE